MSASQVRTSAPVCSHQCLGVTVLRVWCVPTGYVSLCHMFATYTDIELNSSRPCICVSQVSCVAQSPGVTGHANVACMNMRSCARAPMTCTDLHVMMYCYEIARQTNMQSYDLLQACSGGDGEKAANSEAIYSALQCPICYQTFLDPVSSPTGHTYCRRCVECCSRDNNPNLLYSPHTRETFTRDQIKPDYTTRRILEALGLPTGVPERQSASNPSASHSLPAAPQQRTTNQHAGPQQLPNTLGNGSAISWADYAEAYSNDELVDLLHLDQPGQLNSGWQGRPAAYTSREGEEDLTTEEKVVLAGGALVAAGGLAWLLKKVLSDDDSSQRRR